jgi:hypothetical protein
MVGAGLFRQWGIAGIVYQANIESQPKSGSGDLPALSKAAVPDAKSEGRGRFFGSAFFSQPRVKPRFQSGSPKSKKGILSGLLNIPIKTLRGYIYSLERHQIFGLERSQTYHIELP